MQNLTLKIFVSTIIFLLSTIFLFAQTPKRLAFKQGTNLLEWEEKIAPNSNKSFVFAAQKGQKLKLQFTDKSNQCIMDLGKASFEPNNEPHEEIIEVTKDYRLSIANSGEKVATYRVVISLENAKKTNSNIKETVKFAKGATSATLTRTIAASSSIDFIINAKKGQKMDFTIGYDFKDSDVEGSLTEPDLQAISLNTPPKKPNEFTIKRTGNHRLTVKNTTPKKITITLYLDIK